MLSRHLQVILNQALSLAGESQHEFVTVEHMLYCLLEDDDIQRIITVCGGDVGKLREELKLFLAGLEKISDDASYEVQMTLGFQRVIQRAVFHVQSCGKSEVLPENVLVAIYGELQSHAVYFLQKQDLDRLTIVDYVSHGVKMKDEDNLEFLPEPSDQNEFSTESPPKSSSSAKDPLEQFTTNLVEKAKAGKIDPLIGRDQEMVRMVQILCRRTKTNPLLVGDAGVGKTALAEGLALKIFKNEVPDLLQGSEIFALDLGSLIAGTKFRGDFEERLKGVLKRLKSKEKAFLFIDEIHTIIGAGSTSGGSMDASNILKPGLASGEIKCIGSTTYEEYRQIFEKDKALARRFQKIDVNEPSEQHTFQILKGLSSQYEKFHGVRFTPSALKSAAKLSARYLNDRKNPDKAIDVIDEAGAANRLQPVSKRKKVITAQDVEKIIAGIARVPVQTVNREDRSQLMTLETDLKRTIFGQDEAVEQVATAIRLSRAGLGSPEKPVGNFLFAGPTGVGKTELAKEIARLLGIKFIRFDMSEYQEKHTVSRLIGAPPGYVGFDQGGLLTEAIHKSPHAVLLLDEIEKAHPDLFNILLQVMDYGTLTDNNGRKSDFRNVILIMTTNAGARELQKSTIGLIAGTTQGDDKKEIERVFSPEFRNRLDAIVSFNSLAHSTIMKVVDKFISQLDLQLAEKKVTLILTEAAREYFAEEGYDPKMGARPLSRLIQEQIKKVLANEILFGKLVNGGCVTVDVQEGKLNFKIHDMENVS